MTKELWSRICVTTPNITGRRWGDFSTVVNLWCTTQFGPGKYGPDQNSTNGSITTTPVSWQWDIIWDSLEEQQIMYFFRYSWQKTQFILYWAGECDIENLPDAEVGALYDYMVST